MLLSHAVQWATLVGKPVHDRLPIHNINGVNGELCTGFPAGVVPIGAPDNTLYTLITFCVFDNNYTGLSNGHFIKTQCSISIHMLFSCIHTRHRHILYIVYVYL